MHFNIPTRLQYRKRESTLPWGRSSRTPGRSVEARVRPPRSSSEAAAERMFYHREMMVVRWVLRTRRGAPVVPSMMNRGYGLWTAARVLSESEEGVVDLELLPAEMWGCHGSGGEWRKLGLGTQPGCCGLRRCQAAMRGDGGRDPGGF